LDRIQIILAVLTIAMSGVVSGIVTFQLNARRDSRELRRQKLEALYESFDGFVTQLGSHWIPYIGVMAIK
jgi:flagellar basal body-associated protein FliL